MSSVVPTYKRPANPVIPVQPNAPTGLTTTTISMPGVQLDWNDNSSDETGFEIEVSNDGSSWTPVTTVGVGVTTYNHGPLGSGTYYYRVRAAAFIPSPWSNTAGPEVL